MRGGSQPRASAFFGGIDVAAQAGEQQQEGEHQGDVLPPKERHQRVNEVTHQALAAPHLVVAQARGEDLGELGRAEVAQPGAQVRAQGVAASGALAAPQEVGRGVRVRDVRIGGGAPVAKGMLLILNVRARTIESGSSGSDNLSGIRKCRASISEIARTVAVSRPNPIAASPPCTQPQMIAAAQALSPIIARSCGESHAMICWAEMRPGGIIHRHWRAA